MLEEGRSYSGYERNSAFLHLGGKEPAYADVSGASGLDLMEDGRSIAVCDWDLDGREDFWITNRTAPRVRLQHNRSRTANSFLAVKLEGVTCNRNAIGARVELHLEGEQERRWMRTVRAGEGFLAQSSLWIHFGVANGTRPTGISVRWPGGETERFEAVEAGGFYFLKQGTQKVVRWELPDQPVSLADLPVPAPSDPPSEVARIVMASPLPLPETSYLDLDGKRHALASSSGPLLVNLWATWCAPCVAEMNAWTAREKELRATGMRILALSVDDPEKEVKPRSALVRPFLKARKFPFDAGLADADLLDVLEVAGRAQIDKFETLPVPSSLLLDSRGRIAVVYRGPVEVEQLKEDLSLLTADESTRHAAAAHFPGRWIEGPWAPDPTGMIDKFMSFGEPEAARRYLDRFLATMEEARQQDLSEAYFLVGSELALHRNERGALQALSRSIEINPGKTRARRQLATVLFRNRQYTFAVPHLRAVLTERPLDHNSRKMLSLALSQSGDHVNAIPHFRYLSSLDPKDAMGRLWYGHALVRAGQGPEGEAQIRAALQLQPSSPLIQNELAWILATHPDESLRKPAEALELARRAAQASKGRDPRVLNTLAASQAASGDFDSAVRTMEVVLELVRKSGGGEAQLKRFQALREKYAARQPHREPFPVRE